jgi:hypothetical protein
VHDIRVSGFFNQISDLFLKKKVATSQARSFVSCERTCKYLGSKDAGTAPKQFET